MESFISKLVEAPEKEIPEMVDPNLAYFSKAAFNSTIHNVSVMEDRDIYNFIKSNIDYISNLIINSDKDISGALASLKFVTQFNKVIQSVPTTYARRVAVNKTCYDYMTSDLNDLQVKVTLLNMSKYVNKDTIQRLMSIGLDADTACNLALCRYSSVTEKINIKRLNFVICSKGLDIMTEQMIIWIYEKLFDRMGELFNATMLEYYVPVYRDDGEEEEFMEVFSTIALAILTILNNMTTPDIFTVITNYVKEWEYIGKPYVRISLRSLSGDFGRIQVVVEQLNANGIYVP